jgi:HEAT repeat protein
MTRPAPEDTNGQAVNQTTGDAPVTAERPARRTPRAVIDRILATAVQDHPDATPAYVAEVSESGFRLTMVGIDVRAQLSYYLQRVSEEAHAERLPDYYPRCFDFQKLHQRVRIHTSSTTLLRGRIRGRGVGCVYWPEVAGAADESAVVAWASVAERHRHMVVLGQPGYGKTWLLRSEAHRLAVAAQHRLFDGADPGEITLPLWVRLDELAGQLASESGADGMPGARLAMALSGLLASRYRLLPTFAGWLAEHLAHGRCVLLLDALDEVTSRTDLTRLSEALSDFTERNPKARLVITSRLAGYAGVPLQIPDVTHVELMPFTPTDAETFIDAWFPKPADAQRVRDQIRANPALLGLSRIPLLLTLLCVLATDRPTERLPTRRNELYERILRRFLAREHRPANQRPADWEIDHKLELLHHIAQVFADHPDGWTDLMWPDELMSAIAGAGTPYEKLRRCGKDPQHILRELSVDDGLLIPANRPTADSPVPYLFLHRTFHEYLVARHLASLSEQRRWAVIDAHLWFDPDWEQVIALLGGQLDHPEWLLRRLLHHGSDLFHMPLLHAGRVAAETASASAGEIRQVTAGLLELLARPWVGTPDGLMAIRVLNDLVRVASPAPQIGLTRLLDDPHSDVVRAAATALAGTTHEAALTRLTDLLTDPNARAAAARALTGTTDPGALARLTDLLTDPNACVRERAAEALAGTTHEAALTRLTDQLADPNPGVCVAAARALLGTTHEAALTRLTDQLADPNPQVRERATRALAGTTNPQALVRLTDLLTDPNARVRERAAEALAGTTNPEMLTRLAELLGDRRVCAVAARALAGAIDEAMLDRLTDLLTDPGPGISMAATRALVGKTSPGVLARLTDLLTDPAPRVRERAAEALAGTTNPTAVAKLTDLLDDPRKNVAAAAALALTDTTYEAAVAKLTALLSSPRHRDRVRMAAAEALVSTDDPTVAGRLCRYLLRSWASADEQTRLELYKMLAGVAPFAYQSLTAQERSAWLDEVASATRDA